MLNTDEENRKVRILIDLSFLFENNTKRGLGIYASNIVRRLLEREDDNDDFIICLVGFNSLKLNLIELGFSSFKIEELLPKIEFHSLGKVFNYNIISNINYFRKNFIPVIIENNPDIFISFTPERGIPSSPLISINIVKKPKSLVFTNNYRSNDFKNKTLAGRINSLSQTFLDKFIKRGVLNADMIITNSQSAKDKLLLEAGFSKLGDRIEVIPQGVDIFLLNTENENLNDIEFNTLRAYKALDERYFFYDANLENNRSIEELINFFSSFLILGDKSLPNKLIITGRDFFKGKGEDIKPRTILGEKLLKLAEKKGIINNLITTDVMTEEGSEILLSRSFSLINFSYNDRFGFDILKAMSMEIPVIFSNCDFFNEITKGEGIRLTFSNSEDAVKNAERVKLYLSNKSQMKKEVAKSKKVVLNYTWKDSVEKLEKLILTKLN